MQSRERIIDIKALFRCVAEKWRLLLLAGVLVGAVLAGIKGYSEYKLYLLSQGQQETAAEETGSEKSKVLNVMRVAEVDREAYYTESILGKINPHKEGRATADIIVSTAANTAATAAGEEPAVQTGSAKPGNIVNYYSSTVLYRIDYTQVAEELGVDPALLGELVTTTPGAQDSSSISVTVIYPTAEGAGQILDAILAQVRASRAQAQGIYGNHELIIANEAVGVVVDEELFKWANNRAVEIMALVNSQKTLGNNLTSSGAAKIAAVSQRDVAMTAVKWGALGLFAGIAMTMVLIVVYLLAAGKVLSGREFNRQKKKKKIACVPSRKFTIPDAQIALVGDLPLEYLDKLAAEMNKSGASTGIRTSYFAIPCMEQTPDSVISIVNCDASVIVARAEKSDYKGAEDVLDACALLGRDVIGSIVLM